MLGTQTFSITTRGSYSRGQAQPPALPGAGSGWNENKPGCSVPHIPWKLWIMQKYCLGTNATEYLTSGCLLHTACF